MIPTDLTVNSNHSGVTNLIGFSIKEDAGDVATIALRKLNVSGQVICYVNFAAAQSAMIFFPKSVSSEGGVYVQEITGSVTGVLFDAS